jgi:DNA-binding MarR family transcriptional regulator
MRDQTRPATTTEQQGEDQLLEHFDLTSSVSHLLRRAHVRAEDLFDEVMRPPGLTSRQTALLVAAFQNPGATIAELAEAIDVDRNTAAEMISRLIKRGLLSKRRSDTDARAWSVLISPAAVEILRDVLPRNEELMRRILEPLPEEYRPLFVKSLRLMAGLEPSPGSAEGVDATGPA